MSRVERHYRPGNIIELAWTTFITDSLLDLFSATNLTLLAELQQTLTCRSTAPGPGTVRVAFVSNRPKKETHVNDQLAYLQCLEHLATTYCKAVKKLRLLL
jgi:hypothetical protein